MLDGRLGRLFWGEKKMHDFRYVTKNDAKLIKEELYQSLYEVQDLVRDNFTFSFRPIGSSSRNMITHDTKSNIGFDFDINLEINDDNGDFEPKEIRTIMRNAINRVAPYYGYKSCEDSTRVLTIKKSAPLLLVLSIAVILPSYITAPMADNSTFGSIRITTIILGNIKGKDLLIWTKN